MKHTSHNIFCIGGEHMSPYRIFNKQFDEAEYYRIGKHIMDIFPITFNVSFAGFWDCIHPKQWHMLAEIDGFDAEIVEKITLKKIWTS